MMAFYGRPDVTRMSMSHMSRIIGLFNDAGHEARGFVIGDDVPQGEYAEGLGLEWVSFPNQPVAVKLRKMFDHALSCDVDYVSWLGSNNLHSDEYINKCIDFLSQDKPPYSWASDSFLMTTTDRQKTCVWSMPSRDYAVCSSMEFWDRSRLKDVMSKISWADDKKSGFDGRLNGLFYETYGYNVCKVEIDHFNVVDIKGFGDMNSFRGYSTKFPVGPKKRDVIKKFPEYQELENGYFCKNKKK